MHINENNTANNCYCVLQLDSQELADCLGLQTGLYYIKPDELNKATKINCRSLVPPMRHRQRTKRSSGSSRYIRSDQLHAADAEKAVDSRGKHVVKAGDGTLEPRYVINPDLLDPLSSVIVHGLDGATAGHLVLVSENGELLLQCDAKDFTQLSHDDAQQIVVQEAEDEDNCERGDALYVAKGDHTDLSCNLKVL